MPERSDLHSATALLLAVGLGLATAGLFGRAAGYGFLAYDDQLYVTDNPIVGKGLTLSGIWWAFQPANTVGGNYHPLTVVSHMLDVTWFGLDPTGHHVHNIVLHAVNTSLLFLALRSLSGLSWPSLVLAALWGWHPLRVESVAWIAERKDVLSGAFWLLTLVAYAAYAKRPSWRRYGLVLLCVLLGLLSKPMVVTLPLVLLLLDFWPLGRCEKFRSPTPEGRKQTEQPLETTRSAATVSGSAATTGALASGDTPHLEKPPMAVRGVEEGKVAHNGPSSWRFGRQGFSSPQRGAWLVIEKLPLLAMSAALSILTVRAQQAAGSLVTGADSPLWLRINNALQSYVAYLAKTFWPVDLAVLYPLRSRSFELSDAAWAGAAVVAITLVAVFGARRRPWLLVGWLWYLGTLVPVIGLVQVGSQAMADRYTYLPQMGVLMALVWTLSGVVERAARWRRRQTPWIAGAAPVMVMVCLGMLALLTWRQLGYWRDTKTLFAHAIEVTKQNYYAHYMVANQLVLEGDLNGALQHYDAALSIKPNFHEGHYNKGVALMFGGQSLREAAHHLAQALKWGHEPAPTETVLGRCLALMGANAEAEPHLRRAVELDAGRSTALTGLGTVWIRLGQAEQTVALYRRAIGQSSQAGEQRPRIAGHLAWILATHPHRSLGNGAEALKLAVAACRKGGEDDPWLLDALAAAQAENGRYEAAIVSATRALRLALEWQKQSTAFRTAEPPLAYAQLAEGLKARIDRYQRRRPYRDVPAHSPLW